METIIQPHEKQHDSTSIADAFIHRLSLRMRETNMARKIVMFARIGSWAKRERTSNSDYDLLLVCQDSTTLRSIVHVVAEIEKELLQETGVLVTVFTTFKIEELHRALIREPYCLIHLLIYPSEEAFRLWEDTRVLKSLCVGAKSIIGDDKWLDRIVESLKPPDSLASLENLWCQLHNSYVYLIGGQLEDHIAAREGFSKLQYAVRHATALALEKLHIKAHSWGLLVEQHHKLGLPSSRIVDSVFEVRTLRAATRCLRIGKDELAKMYDRAFLYLNDVKCLMTRLQRCAPC